MSPLPFQLLELTLISAQDIAPASKNLRTYAIAWINPDRKLRTKIDQKGGINPAWNDKFMFRVSNSFLDSDSDTSAVAIEIFALGWLRDIPVGSVRVPIGSLVPPSVRRDGNSHRRFVALQIRRPSGRPQGILNVGVTILDNSMKSMPLYSDLSASDPGFNDPRDAKFPGENGDQKIKHQEKPRLIRSQSDCTEIKDIAMRKNKANVCSTVDRGSMIGGGPVHGSSVNGSIVNGSEIGVLKGGGNGSTCNSDVGPSPSVVAAAVARGLYPTPLQAPHQPGSSILGDWTLEDSSSMEGLKSKIERWRTELPALHNNNAPFTSSHQKTPKKGRKHSRRRHTIGNGSIFSCFGDVCGCEVSIVCGASSRSREKEYV